MADIRDQLKKAGLLSEKQARQAKHQERLHAAEVGHAGIEAERRAAAQRDLEEIAARREADRKCAEELQQKEREEAASQRLVLVIRGGWIREATAGARRFFFLTSEGKVSFLDVSDIAARRLSGGSAAVVETRGFVRGEYCVVSERAAEEISRLQPGMIRFYCRDADRTRDAAGAVEEG